MESAVAPRPPPNPPRKALQGVWRDPPAASELMRRNSLTRDELCETIATSQAMLESLLDTIRESHA